MDSGLSADTKFSIGKKFVWRVLAILINSLSVTELSFVGYFGLFSVPAPLFLLRASSGVFLFFAGEIVTMTTEVCWSGDVTQLRLQRVAATSIATDVELRRPTPGLVWRHCEGNRAEIADFRVLMEDLDSMGPEDAYVRGTDVVVTYEPTASRPHRVQIYWRALPLSDHVCSAVDVFVSTQTDQLQSDPRRLTRLRLINGVWEELPDSSPVICYVGRAAGSHVSCIALHHPEDLAQTHRLPDGVLEQRLFVDALEKGVILRARLRVAIVAREHDLALARELRASFLAQPLPLDT